MSISPGQQEAIFSVFDSFEDQNIRYVVLRGYDDLPDAITGSDIDVFVEASSFDVGVRICANDFELDEPTARNVLKLASAGMSQPQQTIETITTSPSHVIEIVKETVTTADFSNRNYVERTFRNGAIVMDLENHLAYKSTLDGSQIRVDPDVEAAMLDRRINRDGFYIPAPPDALAHLVCRGVFDYDGDFPDRYVSKCNDLRQRVTSDPTLDEQFRTVLSKLFYDGDSVVYESVLAGNYQTIRSDLRQYSEY
ncbi:hypothetical protein [Natronorubrum thiooxidans]|uniref:Nucleotidyl transferase AbiEii toxin, Type IV TA system n=1 Tax=Natronorubrum thiooxidans TaxID=308853 RepID=A0A1N7FSA7_9EURY|nr:hypothetical protein [Natronorubrum thiooxidans]SIS03125.1 hypothetical protein SAMN05421752_10827 [Natronorubrum thiooxidans]